MVAMSGWQTDTPGSGEPSAGWKMAKRVGIKRVGMRMSKSDGICQTATWNTGVLAGA